MIYFIILLVHRNSRDMSDCRRKYGSAWDEYCRTVRYRIIPRVYWVGITPMTLFFGVMTCVSILKEKIEPPLPPPLFSTFQESFYNTDFCWPHQLLAKEWGRKSHLLQCNAKKSIGRMYIFVYIHICFYTWGQTKPLVRFLAPIEIFLGCFFPCVPFDGWDRSKMY